MTPDDMARELRAAGWSKCPRHPGYVTQLAAPLAGCERRKDVLHELAQQRKAGTVTRPVVGQGEET